MKNRNLVFLSVLIFFSIEVKPQEKESNLYPALEKQIEIIRDFGFEVIDDYHNLNNLQETQIKVWLSAQDSLAESYFAQEPLMEHYLQRFTQLQNLQEGDISLIRISESGNYFYLKYDEEKEVDKLFYRNSLKDREVELLDPHSKPEGLKNITYLKPSFNGKFIAVGFNDEEDFDSQILIFDVEKKLFLEDTITNINPDFGGIEWLPDNSGFIYLYFPVVNKNQEGYKRNSFSVIHKIGDNVEKRNLIFGNTMEVEISSDYYPKVKIGSSLDKYIIGYSANSSDFYDAYIAKTANVLSGKPDWRPFFKEENKIFTNEGVVRNNHFIFRQGKSTGNSIGKVDIKNPNFNKPEIIADATETEPITDFEVTKDKVFFVKAKYGVDLSLFEFSNDTTNQIQTPFSPGYITFFGTSVAHNYIGAELDGWTSDYTRFNFDKNGSLVKEGLKPEVKYPEYENLISEQILVKSHDGVEVPLSLVYDKRFSGSKERAVFIYVYGAYGEIMSPFFYPIFLDWAVNGGILAFPHVRGGGEKGKEWHTQGMKNLKVNSWRDLIACTEALINKDYTRKGLISLYTVSAGGITGGMAINERPELYSSFIAEVPRLHPFGLESSQTSSSTSYLEYGSVKDSLEFYGLLKMDPYLNLKQGLEYPATLLMPSFNDDRIPLWDSAKYVAKLQNYNKAEVPVLMDIDYDAGHGNFSGYDETVKKYSKIFTFARSNFK